MNTPSPLVPQGTLPAKGKSTFFFKVLMILTVHVVLIGGFLLAGCKDTKEVASNPPDATPAPTTADTLPPVNPAGVSNAVAPQPTATAVSTQAPVQVAQQPILTTQAPPVAPPVQVQAPPVAPTSTDAKEITIAAGDTLGAIAKKNGLSLKALLDANPGVNPKKLKIGQKIQVPAGTSAVATSATGTATPDTGDSSTYVVKSGDTLGKIAKLNHTTYKKIMALNDLKTTSIKVGQKLKLPAATAATTEAQPAAPASVAPVVPLQPAPVPATTTAQAPSTTSSN